MCGGSKSKLGGMFCSRSWNISLSQAIKDFNTDRAGGGGDVWMGCCGRDGIGKGMKPYVVKKKPDSLQAAAFRAQGPPRI